MQFILFVIGINDIGIVFEKVKGISPNWIQFSQTLHIDQDTIDIIEKENPRDIKRCLNEVLKHWLRRNHDCKKHGIPCWRLVCEAVKNGGGNSALAEEIAREYREKYHRPSSGTVSQENYVSSEKNVKLANELYELQLKFEDVFYKTKKAFPEKLLPDILDYLRSHITALLGYVKARRPITVIEDFQSIESISKLFDVLQQNYLSWFNYKLIIRLIDEFLSTTDPLKDKWSQYEKKLEHYFMNSGALLKDAEDIPFGEFNSPPPGTKIIVVKVDREDYKLNHLFFLRRALPEKFNIPEYDLYFSFVNIGCLHLEFWVPNCVYSSIFPLSEEQEVGLAKLGIVEMSDGDGIYSYDLHEKMEYEYDAQSRVETGSVMDTFDQTDYEHFENGFKNIIELKNQSITTVKLEFTGKDMMDIILNEMVPCNFFFTTLLSLPHTKISNLMRNFLKSSLYTIPDSFDISSIFQNDGRNLSMYSAALLMRPQPNDNYLWFALTEFLEGTLWCGSAVFRKAIICKYDIQMSLNNAPNRTFDEEVLDIHLNDVYQNVMKVTEFNNNELQQIISLGAIHMNILDISDTNKGVKEFVDLISQHLNYNLGIIGLSIDDIKELNSLTLMFQESKISYIIRQAVEIQSQSSDVPIKFIITCSKEDTKDHRDKAGRILLSAITKETARLGLQPLQASILVLDPSSLNDIKKLNSVLDTELPLAKRYIKLSWLFLRGALNNMDEIIISYDKLKDIASKLGIKEMELKEFLETFTKFMSILYLPRFKLLQNVVILRPIEFINTLSSLFKTPQGREDFNGVYNISESSIDDIAQLKIPNKELADAVIKALCSVGLALKTTCDKIDKRTSPLTNPIAPLLFIPLARSGQVFKKIHVTSLFIVFDSKFIQPDCQSFFISKLLTLKGSSLLPGSDYHPNVFKILVAILRQEYILSFIFHGTFIEVVIEGDGESRDVLEKIILCCKEALAKMGSTLNHFSYKLALRCVAPGPAFSADNYIHPIKRVFDELLPKTKFCHHCEALDTKSPLRKKWKEVVQKMYENEEKRRERVNLENLIKLAQNLGQFIISTQSLNNLASQLQVPLEGESLVILSKLCLPWERVLVILLKWEKKGEATKESLSSALRRLGYPSVVLD